MNTTRHTERELKLELKYCERCGGLWLRPAGGKQVYCAGCARQMGEMPPPSREVDASIVHDVEDSFEAFLSSAESLDMIGEEA